MDRMLLSQLFQRGASMNIRTSAAIRQNYNEIADMCRKTAEPIFLAKNVEGDLVVIMLCTPKNGSGDDDGSFLRKYGCESGADSYCI